MKRWMVVLIVIVLSVLFVLQGEKAGNVPETQHNGATLCLACVGVG